MDAAASASIAAMTRPAPVVDCSDLERPDERKTASSSVHERSGFAPLNTGGR
jgi:hypothetical protein